MCLDRLEKVVLMDISRKITQLTEVDLTSYAKNSIISIRDLCDKTDTSLPVKALLELAELIFNFIIDDNKIFLYRRIFELQNIAQFIFTGSGSYSLRINDNYVLFGAYRDLSDVSSKIETVSLYSENRGTQHDYYNIMSRSPRNVVDYERCLLNSLSAMTNSITANLLNKTRELRAQGKSLQDLRIEINFKSYLLEEDI